MTTIAEGGRFTIGWQGWPPDQGGPGFVVVRRTAVGTLKVAERFGLDGAGWTRAWAALLAADPAGAEKVRSALEARRLRAGRRTSRAVPAEPVLCVLPRLVFAGGYRPGLAMTQGREYDAYFLGDRLSVRDLGGAVLADAGYPGIEDIEVSGPGEVRAWSRARQAVVTEMFGLTGALAAYAKVRIKTFVRVREADSELHFLCTTVLPDELRIQLSPALGAIRHARAEHARAGAAGPGDPSGTARPVSLVDELSRLAGMLDSGLLTREEFDLLKTRLITGG